MKYSDLEIIKGLVVLKLQFSTKNVLMFLIRKYSENESKPVSLFYQDIADNTGASVKTVQRCLKQLKTVGYVQSYLVQSLQGKAGRSACKFAINAQRITLDIDDRVQNIDFIGY